MTEDDDEFEWPSYDRERIDRFIYDTLEYWYPKTDDPYSEGALAAASLLGQLLDDIEKGRNPIPRLTALGYVKTRSKKFSPDRAPLSGEEIELAWRYWQGEISKKEALDWLCDKHPASDKTITRYLDALVKRIEQHHQVDDDSSFSVENSVNWGRRYRARN